MISTGTQPTIAGANGIHPPPETDQALRRVIDQVATNANAEVAFGTARVIGERTFIPVAQISYGFGGGSGSGSPPARIAWHSAPPGRSVSRLSDNPHPTERSLLSLS
jgi:hypothetical protein